MTKVSTSLTKRCKKCGEDRELSLFKYKLTRAQARAQGYAANVAVELEGKTCNLCKRKPKPLSRKSRAELERMVTNGDLTDLVFNAIIKERHDKAQNRRSEAMHKHYANKLAKEWSDYTKELRAEIRIANNAIASAKRREDYQGEQFARLYYDRLIKVRDAFGNIDHEKVPEVRWFQYAKREFTRPECDMEAIIREVRVAWDGLDIRKRVKMRQPLIILTKYF